MIAVTSVHLGYAAPSQPMLQSQWQLEPSGEWAWENDILEVVNRPAWSGDKQATDYRITVWARSMPEDGEFPRVWISFRYLDEWNRYAIVLRGGSLNDVQLLKFKRQGSTNELKPQIGDKPATPDLVFSRAWPLPFTYKPGEWYKVTIEAINNTIAVWINDSVYPVLTYTDTTNPLSGGAVALGGHWLKSQFKDFQLEPITAKEQTTRSPAPGVDHGAERLIQRQKYKAVQVEVPSSRGSQSLDGDWLFKPVQELDAKNNAFDPESNDQEWHVLRVPQFWNQIGWWNMYSDRGQSETFRRAEDRRTEAFTFDSAKTDAGWYRQWLNFPKDLNNQRVELRFTAVAAQSIVYFNGERLGEHTGMFAPFSFDITDRIKLGQPNLLALFVNNGKAKIKENKVETVAITISVTTEMLSSIPKGYYNPTENLARKLTTNRVGGIWQPVSLEFYSPANISDVYVKPRTNGASIDLSITGLDPKAHTEVKASLAGGNLQQVVNGDPTGKARVVLDFPVKNPVLWWPGKPHLYDLTVELFQGGKRVDTRTLKVGLRTFEIKNARVYLNDLPYFPIGASQFPAPLSPNDAPLAEKFTKLMREGNQLFVRSPPGTTREWFDAADRYGIGLVPEGTWPWLMVREAPLADAQLLDVWRQEMLDLVKSLRNHPSILAWSLGNEFYPEDSNVERRQQKLRIYSDLIKAIRELDPTRPILHHSGYVPNEETQKELKALNLDDGDFVSQHMYSGWYTSSVFDESFYRGKIFSKTSGKPNMTQEASTGYPNCDTGHSERKYVEMLVPQAWIGDDAYEQRDPKYFMQHQAIVTKEWVEDARRTRSIDGFQAFSNACWYNESWNAQGITPYPVHAAAKQAMSRILVSMEQRNRHLFTGEPFSGELHVAHDDPTRQKLVKLNCQLTLVDDNGRQISQTRLELPDCDYFNNVKIPFSIPVPPLGRQGLVKGRIELELRSGTELLSRNRYDVTISDPAGVKVEASSRPLVWVGGELDYSKVFERLGLKLTRNEKNWTSNAVLIWTGKGVPEAESELGKRLLEHVRLGGRLILLETQQAEKLLGENRLRLITNRNIKWKWHNTNNAEFINIEDLTHPLFSGLDSMSLKWWNSLLNKSPYAAQASYEISSLENLTPLATYIAIHGYEWRGPKLCTVAILSEGKGKIVFSELCTLSGQTDPVAATVLRNLLTWVSSEP